MEQLEFETGVPLQAHSPSKLGLHLSVAVLAVSVWWFYAQVTPWGRAGHVLAWRGCCRLGRSSSTVEGSRGHGPARTRLLQAMRCHSRPLRPFPGHDHPQDHHAIQRKIIFAVLFPVRGCPGSQGGWVGGEEGGGASPRTHLVAPVLGRRTVQLPWLPAGFAMPIPCTPHPPLALVFPPPSSQLAWAYLAAVGSRRPHLGILYAACWFLTGFVAAHRLSGVHCIPS